MIRTYLLNRKELENIHYDEAMFSENRREKISKIKFDEDKELSACVELLLIYAVKMQDPAAVLPLPVQEAESGKLSLAGSPFHFNLSHAKDWAVCSISDESVGVDIEYVKVKEILHPDKILYPEEYKLLSFVSNPLEKKKYFYECWVTKESYLKNLGLGLTVRPSAFMINEDTIVTDGREKLKKRYVHVYKSEEIKNTDWKFEAGYRMAVCSMKKDPDSKAEVVNAKMINEVIGAGS